MTQKILLQGSYEAAEDLSAATLQFCAVKRDANGKVVKVAAATDQAVGVLLNSPALGEIAEVCQLGVCDVRVTASSVALGSGLGIDLAGRFQNVTAATLPGALQFGRVESIESTDHDGATVTAFVDFLTLKRI